MFKAKKFPPTQSKFMVDLPKNTNFDEYPNSETNQKRQHNEQSIFKIKTNLQNNYSLIIGNKIHILIKLMHGKLKK